MAESTILTSMIRIKKEALLPFGAWREKMNLAVASFPGFVSLEMQPPQSEDQTEWTLIQRFRTAKELDFWRSSEKRKQLFSEIHPLLSDSDAIREFESDDYKQSVTEVFVTKVVAEKQEAYRMWASKIQQVEATFPGYQGVYIQSPGMQGGNWITVLRFDTPEHLDAWLISEKRKEILKEADTMVEALESHRVVSPFAGWFAKGIEPGKLPAVWKQTMLVLLVLFPIVMLELKFLSPLTSTLNLSLATFIGNAISVSLISWPLMPLAIRFLRWWIVPSGGYSLRKQIGGIFVVLSLYLIEIVLFWV